MLVMKKLKDKVIIVTGGNGLIGKSIIGNIRSHGGIAINFDINFDEKTPHQVKCDITNRNKVELCVQEVFRNYGRIDGLVNNAYPRTRDWGNTFEDIDPLSWSKNVEIQLNSVFVIIQEVIKYMKPLKRGSIVNIASIYGVVGNDFTIYKDTNINPPAAYSAIKGGIINFTKYMASYLGSLDIRVNCVSPGGIFDSQDPKFVSNFEERVPLKRMGNPDDISPSISFLLSEEAKYITGHNLVVDGGWTII
jgi:NAD(P)-dependent dehydrogenase (short-subunit alcohol dehydrogenase family)